MHKWTLLCMYADCRCSRIDVMLASWILLHIKSVVDFFGVIRFARRSSSSHTHVTQKVCDVGPIKYVVVSGFYTTPPADMYPCIFTYTTKGTRMS